MISEKIKIIAIVALSVMVCACVSSEAENQKTDFISEGKTYTPIHRQVVKAGETLVSDTENARYDDMDEGTVIIASVPSKPAIEDSLDIMQETVTENINVIETDASYIPDEEKVYEPSVSYQIATIYFADGSPVVDSKYNSKIKEIAKLAKDKKAQINVYGFSSSRTKNTDVVTHKMINFNVSMKRAENVVNALVKAGVPRSSITMEALSDSQPLYQEVMPEGERLNRRAEIYISY